MIFEYGFVRFRRLLFEARRDGLTGLLNRTAGEREIERILRAKTFQGGAFLFLDLDHFKSLNDTFGHRQGDQVLIRCADTLRAALRSRDVLCRLGGDEFIVFMPCDGDMSFLDEAIGRLLKTMRCDIAESEKSASVSVSIGVALAPAHGTTFEALYIKADRALYCAKAKGRNGFAVYDERM